MAGQVDAREGRLEQGDHPGPDRGTVADEGEDAAIVRPVGGQIQDLEAGNGPHGCRNRVDRLGRSPLGKIGDTLDHRPHRSIPPSAVYNSVNVSRDTTVSACPHRDRVR